MENGNPEDEGISSDPRIEQGLEWLLKSIQGNYKVLNTRVIQDTERKIREEAKKRLERERKILKNKIAFAFPDLVPVDKRPDNMPTAPEDVFSIEDGLTFLASEIGVDSWTNLDPMGKEIGALVGYQKLALQIVGALKAPISKQKVPMTWPEIKNLVLELRSELGLP